MKVRNLNETIATIKAFGKEAEKDIEAVTEQVARFIELEAKSTVVADNGKLGQSIKAIKNDKLNWSVEAGGVLAPYAPFVEFGTGGLVEVPEELRELANKFRGKGIKKINLRARPFLYPALLKGRNQYLEKLTKVLNKYGKVK